MQHRPPATSNDLDTLTRRGFLSWAGRSSAGLGLLGASGLLAACASDEPAATAPPATTPAPPGTPAPTATATATPTPAEAEGAAIVGDVIDFALSSDEWEGPFGFVTFRLHRGVVDGEDVWFIRTDASDQEFAQAEGLVFVPKIAPLAGTEAVGAAYLVDGGVEDQATVLSSEPGRDDFSPAWQIHRVRWNADPRLLASVADVEAAAEAGDVTLEQTEIVVNYPVVKWSTGELPVDDERTGYLGPGQLLDPPDTEGMTVRFKLHECYPAVRYIVTDVAMTPMAEGMRIADSPRLDAATAAGATGRTNVFMNGIEGPGPMGFQPSVFDTQAGDPEWSPYWDHMTYAWKDGVEARVLTTEEEVHAARDAGELDEFPGTPDTDGRTFVVNCPVPVLAENTFQA